MRVTTQPSQILVFANASKYENSTRATSFANTLIAENANSTNGKGNAIPSRLASKLAGEMDITNLNGQQYDSLLGQLNRSGVMTFEDIGTMLVLGLKWHPPSGLNGEPSPPPTGTQNILQDAKNYLEFAKQQSPGTVPSLEHLISIFENIKTASVVKHS